MEVDHTSACKFGQVYLPSVNAALMVGCIGLVLGFRSSANLAAAYGVAVTSTMVITTLLVVAVARERWNWSRPAVLAVTGPFLAVDLAFFGANVLKIPAGGWLPLVIGAALFTTMTTWHRGRLHVDGRRRLGTVPLQRFIETIVDERVPRVAGAAVYLGADAGRTPSALEANLATHQVLHEQVYVVTVQLTDIARIAPDGRATVHDLGNGFQQVLLRFGFMEEPNVPPELRRALAPPAQERVDDAFYFVGGETIVATEIPGMALWRERLFVLLHRNASSVVRYFCLPRDRIVTVGSVVAI